MATEGTAETDVAAPPAAVMDVIADFEAYPRWASQVKSAEVLTTGADGRPATVRFAVDAGVLADGYVLTYEWDGDRAVTWTLVEGRVQKAQEGAYRLTRTAGGTHVDYELMVDLAVPIPGFLVRKAQKAVMRTAVDALRQEVESR